MENIYIKKLGGTLLILVLLYANFSCKKFLDAKPSSDLSELSVSDLQGLLDDYDTMNKNFSCDGEVSSDNYYQTDANYNSLSNKDEKDYYIWSPQAQRVVQGGSGYWTRTYKVVYNANLILETLNKPNSLDATTINNLKGSAYFFRAYAHYQMAQLYAKPFDGNTASQDLGIPYRTSSALEDKSERSTVQHTYDMIISDLQQAINLLPVITTIKSRPNKTAAYAALARTYLSMADYTNAGKMADECLKLYSTLIDYNTVSQTSTTPFSRFNNEVIFQSLMASSGILNPTTAKINANLYNSYELNDLRKKIFFKQNTGTNAGTYKFTGNYEPVTTPTFFDGLATDEILLVRAECFARAGNTSLAMTDLNNLLRKRYVNTLVNPFIDKIAADANDALKIILNERRKELIFRGIRWSDLRRLNKEPSLQTTLTRTIGATTYTLPPNDLRYTLLIPQIVIDATGFQQNPR